MTWGNQNTQEEGFEQMDYSLEEGINFFDTAELYPVPANADTYAETERIIGNWFASRNNREQVVLATKIAGPGAYTAHIRTTGFSPDSIHQALDGSLQRLQDGLYRFVPVALARAQFQLFWFVGDVNHKKMKNGKTTFEEILHTLQRLHQSG